MSALSKAIAWLKEPTGLGEFDIIEEVSEEMETIKGYYADDLYLKDTDGENYASPFSLKECLDEFVLIYNKKIINVLESFVGEGN